ncbi:MAG: HlyD family secretion protein [Candidatus Adiutrix sp.]|nr:HlyD family secretion protein [Candidatus Adiutrix sp.]
MIASCEEEFRRYKKLQGYQDCTVPYYTTARLSGLTIERIDWERWKARQDNKQDASSIDDSRLKARVAELESQLAEAQAERTEAATERDRLSEALEKANARIAESKTAYGEQWLILRTQAALNKKNENALNAWKAAFGFMLNVGVRCVKEEKKLLSRPDLQKMFQEESAAITDAQMEFFREKMPDEYIDRIGGNSWKKHPPSAVSK